MREAIEQAVIGYRRWRVGERGILLPVTDKSVWYSGINEAFCSYPGYNPNEEVPHTGGGGNCSCGFHAYFDLSYALNEYTEEPDSIIGAIAGAGKTQIYETGFRSKQAQILALCFVPGKSVLGEYLEEFDRASDYSLVEETLAGCRNQLLVSQAAKRYGVPLLDDVKDLFDYASSKGFSPIQEFRFKETKAERNGENLIIHRNDGSTEYLRRGLLHRDDDEPAFYGPDFPFDSKEPGSHKSWWKNGEKHRDGDQPAVILKDANGTVIFQEWWVKGKRHRGGNRPAVIDLRSRAPKKYYQNGREVPRSIVFKEGF